jgi:hypothetical protein
VTVILLLVLSFFTFILGFAWGVRRGIRRNLKLYSETVQVIGVMLKDGDVDAAKEFIHNLTE